jgi:hypothetical protein
MQSNEAVFVKFLKNIKGMHSHQQALETLMLNVHSFRALCQTKHVNKRQELATYLLKVTDKVYNRSQFTHCLNVVYDDPFSILLEKSVESLAKNSYKIPLETQRFVQFFQLARGRATNQLKQIHLHNIHQDQNWFRICSLLMVMGMRNSFAHWRLFYTLNRDDWQS